MRRYIQQVLRDEDGATMVEYALMMVLIAVACIGVVIAIGNKVNARYENVVEKVPGN